MSKKEIKGLLDKLSEIELGELDNNLLTHLESVTWKVYHAASYEQWNRAKRKASTEDASPNE